jgi:acetyl-CoA carboxylase biotin carboxyl carrier protein
MPFPISSTCVQIKFFYNQESRKDKARFFERWCGRALPAKTPKADGLGRITFAMDIKSPAVGKVLRLSVETGAQVARGDELMVIESMKVEIPVKAPASGRIAEFRVKPGDQIQRNVVLAVIET